MRSSVCDQHSADVFCSAVHGSFSDAVKVAEKMKRAWVGGRADPRTRQRASMLRQACWLLALASGCWLWQAQGRVVEDQAEAVAFCSISIQGPT